MGFYFATKEREMKNKGKRGLMISVFGSTLVTAAVLLPAELLETKLPEMIMIFYVQLGIAAIAFFALAFTSEDCTYKYGVAGMAAFVWVGSLLCLSNWLAVANPELQSFVSSLLLMSGAITGLFCVMMSALRKWIEPRLFMPIFQLS